MKIKGFHTPFWTTEGYESLRCTILCTILIWQRITFATYVTVNMCRSRSVTLFIHLFILCAYGLVEQVCIIMPRQCPVWDRAHTPLTIDPCVLILFRRVSVACLYPFRKIHRRALEGLCVKHANICVMWNTEY